MRDKLIPILNLCVSFFLILYAAICLQNHFRHHAGNHYSADCMFGAIPACPVELYQN